MLLPRVDCDIEEPPEGSCTFLHDAAVAALDAALVGLDPFLPDAEEPGCAPFRAYVSMNRPVAEVYDSLSIHLVRYSLHPESKRLADSTGPCAPPISVRHIAAWRMELWENGYPVGRKTDTSYTPPAPETLDAVNAHLYAHGMAAYSALHTAIARRGQPDGIVLPSVIEKVAVGDMVPLGPDGGTAGWAWDVLMDVDG